MSNTAITFAGTINGTDNKGAAIGPYNLNYLLASQRGSLCMDIEVAPADAARVITLPVEGTAQSLFVLCADQEFTFTINGGPEVYTIKPGLPAAGASQAYGFFVLGPTPLVASIEVTGGTLASTGWLMRVMEQ